MKQIDMTGTWRGVVTEAVVSQTKNGFPQYVVRLNATERYVDGSAEMEANGLTEPGWVDVSGWEESIVAFLVLANAEKKLLNFEQVMKAFGWDGTSFAGLAKLNVEGRTILFRTDENSYEGNTTIQVNWVDDKDAPVNRQLSALDDGKLADLDAKFGGMLSPVPTTKPAPAKPAPAKPATPKPETTAPKTGKGGKGKADKAAEKPAATAPKAGPPTASKPPKAAAPTASSSIFTDVSDENAQMDVWNAVNRVKGDAEDASVAETWVEGCRSVCGDREESALTKDEWIAVGQHVMNELGLDANVAPFE